MKTENKFDIYNQLSQIYLEEGDLKLSIETLEEYAHDLERVFKILKKEHDNLVSNKKDKVEEEGGEEEEEKLNEVEYRIFNCLLSIVRTYQQLGANAIFAREWQTVQQFLDCSEQILSQLNTENQHSKERLQLIGMIVSRQYLFRYQQYLLTNSFDQALQNLELSFSMQQQSLEFKDFQMQQVFFYSLFVTLHLEKQDLPAAAKYIQIIENLQANKKSKKANKYNEVNSDVCKIKYYTKLNRSQDALDCINAYKQTQEGKKNRYSTKISILQIETNYLESIKDYSKAIESMNECLLISKQFYGEESLQHQNLTINLYNLILLQIQQNNAYFQNSQEIQRISQNSKKLLDNIKSKGTYGRVEKQFQELLDQCIQQSQKID